MLRYPQSRLSRFDNAYCSDVGRRRRVPTARHGPATAVLGGQQRRPFHLVTGLLASRSLSLTLHMTLPPLALLPYPVPPFPVLLRTSVDTIFAILPVLLPLRARTRRHF